VEKLLPQNVEAEGGVLGSIIIDPEAIVQVADFLMAEDFYRDAHRTIYETIMQLFDQREAADFITICDELDRKNKLEEVGGASYITSLINQVPTSANIEYYGRIVERTSILRRLIHAAGEIAATAYEEVDAVIALDKAEKLIFGISQRHAHADFSSLGELLSDYMTKLDQLHERRGAVVGVPTGFADLDRLTGGLQKSDLIILAARPAVGKTSLCLSLAHNAAIKYKKSIAIFSLEMSKEQLVQRLLSMDAGIDQQRLRTGWIEDDEWERIVFAMGTLTETSIWLDDTAGISTMEMRSKARRLQAEHGVDLIIVDYLQLMQSSAGGKRNENRVQEISEISRNLKGLARELNVPVLALAQLSRAVESRQSKVPQLSDLRESGCLTGDTLVYLPELGEYQRIDALMNQIGFKVLALDPQTWKLEPKTVTRAFPTGHKPVFKLTTRLGRTIRATANHKFLAFNSWKRLDELELGAYIALPRTLSGPQVPTMTQDELALLGHPITTSNMVTRQMQAALGGSYSGTSLYKHGLGRERAARVALVTNCDELARLAISDVYWDEIISVEPDGEEEVYDLTVEDHHNFVANNIIVHNSIEQDADVVMFIYRDDVYNPESERKNIADIIVAKHRNGPVGEVSLYFQANQTRFRDLEVSPPADE
jgi:replicative DNA helicase